MKGRKEGEEKKKKKKRRIILFAHAIVLAKL